MDEFDYEEYLDDYFDVMEVTEESKEKRKDIAKEIRLALLFWFMLIGLMREYGVMDEEYAKTTLRDRLKSVIYKFVLIDVYIIQYIDKLVEDIASTTFKGMEKEYNFSDERATEIGANEANTIENRNEWQEAVDAGYRYKTWVTEKDNRVRKDHALKDGKKIPINNYFVFPDCRMLYAHDELNGSARQVINCRCSMKYSM